MTVDNHLDEMLKLGHVSCLPYDHGLRFAKTESTHAMQPLCLSDSYGISTAGRFLVILPVFRQDSLPLLQEILFLLEIVLIGSASDGSRSASEEGGRGKR